MPSRRKTELEYWLMEVEYGLEDERQAHIRIGKALYNLRGPKYKKADHMWRQDSPPNYVTTFAPYCKWKWNFSEARVNQLILAYEVYRDLNEEGNTTRVVSSSEKVLRPLTRLKNKEDRQKAWELASKGKVPGEKVTSKDTALAVEIVKGTSDAQLANRVQDVKIAITSDKAEKELQEISAEGITTADAFKRVHASWEKLTENEDEKTKQKLANVYREYWDSKYPA